MRSFSIVVVVLFAGIALCGQASAEVGVPAGTVQQAAADALFLQYAPAPPVPGIVCLVDSGVDASPDTNSDPGRQSCALAEHEHSKTNSRHWIRRCPAGTLTGMAHIMAMIAAAPADGWGMVGLAPTSVRVYNLKVFGTRGNRTTFGIDMYSESITYCHELSSSSTNRGRRPHVSCRTLSPPKANAKQSTTLPIRQRAQSGRRVGAEGGRRGRRTRFRVRCSRRLRCLREATHRLNTTSLAMCPFANRGVGLAVCAPGCQASQIEQHRRRGRHRE